MARDDDLTQLQELAERMQLDEGQTENFISSGMKRLGYKPRMDWDEPDDGDGKDGDSDFFSQQRSRRSRPVGGDKQGRGGRRASGDWQYGD